jgi:hypothetical protein
MIAIVQNSQIARSKTGGKEGCDGVTKMVDNGSKCTDGEQIRFIYVEPKKQLQSVRIVQVIKAQDRERSQDMTQEGFEPCSAQGYDKCQAEENRNCS